MGFGSRVTAETDTHVQTKRVIIPTPNFTVTPEAELLLCNTNWQNCGKSTTREYTVNDEAFACLTIRSPNIWLRHASFHKFALINHHGSNDYTSHVIYRPHSPLTTQLCAKFALVHTGAVTLRASADVFKNARRQLQISGMVALGLEPAVAETTITVGAAMRFTLDVSIVE